MSDDFSWAIESYLSRAECDEWSRLDDEDRDEGGERAVFVVSSPVAVVLVDDDFPF